MSRSSIPRPLRELVAARDGGRCRYCGLHQFGHGAVFHVNHVVPRSKGGLTTEHNLVLQCPNSSLHKADRLTAIDAETGEQSALFHPLQQEWHAHFRLQFDGTVVGLSPVARATIAALHMNEPIPRIARLCQMALGILRSAHSG